MACTRAAALVLAAAVGCALATCADDCSLVPGHDRMGGDLMPLGKGFRNASSAQACCAQCRATPSCQFFAFSPSHSHSHKDWDDAPATASPGLAFPVHNCWLKAEAGTLQPNGERTAGSTAPPGPPAPYVGPCDNADLRTRPWCNASLGLDARVAAAVQAMTLGEKVEQLSTFTPKVQPGIPRLGFPSYGYHSEGLHGLRDSMDIGKPATVFPQVTGMAATFNLSLVRDMARVMALEARAANSYMLQQGLGPFAKGGSLFFWSPTMNLIRDPRWGRGQESISESPFLNGLYSAVFLQQFQAPDSKGYPATGATCKHFVAYSLEGDGRQGINRHNFDAAVPLQDLVETYLPSFQRCVVEGKPAQVMCSYNAVNGTPTCADPWLLTGTLRAMWAFDGLVVSDQGAIADIFGGHNYSRDGEHGVAVALNAGCDMNDGALYTEFLPAAVSNGLVSEARIDQALRAVLRQRFRLGSFDRQAGVPWAKVPVSVMGSAANGVYALQAARESIALLNNSAGTLPLDAGALAGQTVLLTGVGDFLTETLPLIGGKPDYAAPQFVTLAAGMAAHEPFASNRSHLVVLPGCGNSLCATANISAVVAAAKQASVTVLVAGIDGKVESEGHDRTALGLPGQQAQLVRAVQDACAAAGRRFVLVLLNGGPVSADWARHNVATVVDVFEGGQFAGTAMAEVLFGDVNPSGRLPFTVYPAAFAEATPMTGMAMRSANGSWGRTFRFLRPDQAPLWYFGDGQSYTSWALEWVQRPAAAHILPGRTMAMTASLTNTGPRAGSRTVFAFVAGENATVEGGPFKALWAVDKVFLEAGQSKTLTFATRVVPGTADLVWCTFCSVDARGHRSIRPGRYTIFLGGSGRLSPPSAFGPDGRRLDGADELTADVALEADAPLSAPLSPPLPAAPSVTA